MTELIQRQTLLYPLHTRCTTFPNSPHPKSLSQSGRGTLSTLAPLLPLWEKGLGDEGLV